MRFATKILCAFLSSRIYTAHSAQLVIVELFTQKCPLPEIRELVLPSFTQEFLFSFERWIQIILKNAFPASYKAHSVIITRLVI
jgi:hypothetical protein